ncbi:hypothetical protein ET33_11165 [Paenibacillus tyrfis]|uniref:Uncharacterized protein n=1 Tax=Paenibacillus tyrfis TaxID=1501230 RepID=A0A081P0L8_9BACL|nr:hypothetical protein ET33_11165 [Paenibacillus tyrfis]
MAATAFSTLIRSPSVVLPRISRLISGSIGVGIKQNNFCQRPFSSLEKRSVKESQQNIAIFFTAENTLRKKVISRIEQFGHHSVHYQQYIILVTF